MKHTPRVPARDCTLIKLAKFLTDLNRLIPTVTCSNKHNAFAHSTAIQAHVLLIISTGRIGVLHGCLLLKSNLKP